MHKPVVRRTKWNSPGRPTKEQQKAQKNAEEYMNSNQRHIDTLKALQHGEEPDLQAKIDKITNQDNL